MQSLTLGLVPTYVLVLVLACALVLVAYALVLDAALGYRGEASVWGQVFYFWVVVEEYNLPILRTRTALLRSLQEEIFFFSLHCLHNCYR